MEKDITLVILAAGMGSRYGGLKQVDSFGLNGESIIEFSIYDAIRAGFNKLVLIIREEHEEIFEKNLVSKIRPYINVEYAYQSLDKVPSGVDIDENREKPLGTTHALMCAKDHIDGPFTVINADDFYGEQTYKVMADFLRNEVSDNKGSMIGFIVENTITDHGTVTRGVCVNEDGYLTDIVETDGIKREGDRVVDGEGNTIKDDAVVSMNFWGFTPKVIEMLEDKFMNFTKTKLVDNPLKAEALLPTDVGQLIKDEVMNVEILNTPEKWIGVTYQDDKPMVIKYIQDLQTSGAYPEKLWEE